MIVGMGDALLPVPDNTFSVGRDDVHIVSMLPCQPRKQGWTKIKTDKKRVVIDQLFLP